MHKEHLTVNNKKTSNLIKQQAKDLNRHSSKADVQMSKKHKKRCWTSLAIREMQIKITMIYHFTPTMMVITSKTRIISFGEDAEKLGPSYTVGIAKMEDHCGNQWGGWLLNKRNIELPLLLFPLPSLVSLFATPWTAAHPSPPVPHHLPKFSQVHVHFMGDAIQPSHPLMPSSPSALNLSQHQSLF